MIQRLLIVTLIGILAFCDREPVSLEPVQDAELSGEKQGPLDTMADPDAVRGGTLNVWGASYPASINMWLDYNSTSADITGKLFEPLVGMDSATAKPVGILAESWTISPDQLTFTFKIRPQAKWSDGTPITAKDIVFHYKTIMNPDHMTSIFRVSMQRFEEPVAVDERTVRIQAKERHFSNFWEAGGMVAFPSHLWEGKNFNDINDFEVVSGPYKVLENKTNRYLLLQRRGDWWGRILNYNTGKYNFDYIRYRFIEDRNKTLEAFKKGDFDYYGIYTASIWAEQTEFKETEQNHVIRQEIKNRNPRGFQGFAINMRKDKFKDVKVRKALAHLINRKLMNEKIMYNSYVLLNSYFPDLYNGYQNPNAPVIEYSPEKAKDLLKEAGYTVNDRGEMVKDGQKLTFSFLSTSSESRHLNIYIEDLKKAGIEANIEQVSYSSARQRLNEFDYDIYWVNWGAGRLKDPEPMWSSETANQTASNNLTGFADEKADALISQLKTEMNPARREALLKQLDKRIFELHPYILLWQSDNSRLLYWNKFGKPENPLGKYGREDAVMTYWYYDPEKVKALSDAKKSGEKLPGEPATVIY